MTNAPERIWVWKNKPHGETVISTPSEPYPTGSPEYIRLDLHEAAVAAARAEGWNAAINAAADEAEEHKHFAKGIECCAECIRKMARAAA